MQAFRKDQRRGAALMLSLWALFLLSAMVISWALDIDARLTVSGHENRILEAQALASSGAEVAQYRNIKPDSPALVGQFGKDQRYEVHITGEGGRLNINWVAASPENPARVEVLRKYLENKGIDLDERDRMIDTLLDWIDPDNLVRLNGAEEEAGYQPANRPLKRLDELKKIKGWEEFTAAKDWASDLTVESTGPIDLKWASRDVLLALPGASEDRVDQFLALRSGPDGIDGTEDDAPMDPTQASLALGIPQQQLAGLTYTDTTMRVVSVGRSGDVTRTVRLVLRQGNLISWKEF
jgi:general secretion pathway protein K